MSKITLNKQSITIPDPEAREGITISYVKSRRVLVISAWYDSIVGMEPTEIELDDFLNWLEIPAVVTKWRRWSYS